MNRSEWKAALKPYMTANLKNTSGKIINSVVPCVLIFILIIFMVQLPITIL